VGSKGFEPLTLWV